MNIIFYHIHQNGDSFTSRMFVNHFIKHTKNKNFNYFYTSKYSVESHCEDLGIPKENFNVYDVSEIPRSKMFHKDGNNLYINVWIGQTKGVCCIWCLNGWSDLYNVVIEGLKEYDINIPLIKNTDQRYFPIERNFEYELDKKYDKIITIYNCRINTFELVNYLKHNEYIDRLSKMHKNYLFVTFVDTGLPNENVMAFKDIFKGEFPKGYGIEFALFNKVADKVIFLPSGVSQLSFYHEKDVKNKYAILYYLRGHHLVPKEYLPTNDIGRDTLCIDKYGYHVEKIWIDKMSTLEELVERVDKFITN
jgi:hypothetical protein